MKEYLPSLGFLLIFAGIAVVVISSFLGAGAKNTKFAVGGFLGPLPFGFANSPGMLKLVIGVLVLMIIFNFALRYMK